MLLHYISQSTTEIYGVRTNHSEVYPSNKHSDFHDHPLNPTTFKANK